MALTDTACRNVKCSLDRAYQRHSDEKGLYLEVTRSGSKCWRMKYRFAGKEKLLSLGQYPEVTLAAARTKCDKAREQLAAGIDPSEAKRDAKRVQMMASETAFEKIARQWFADWSTNKAERHAGT